MTDWLDAAILFSSGGLTLIAAATSEWLRAVISALFHNFHRTTIVVRKPDGTVLKIDSSDPLKREQAIKDFLETVGVGDENGESIDRRSTKPSQGDEND